MKRLTFNASDQEVQALMDYCKKTERTYSDVLRDLVRNLTGLSNHPLNPNNVEKKRRSTSD